MAEYDYYPYGAVLSTYGTERFKYTGKELDDGYNLNLYYYGARYYDAMLGRFISPEPLREYLNPYSYSWNDPINYIGPWEKIIGLLDQENNGVKKVQECIEVLLLKFIYHPKYPVWPIRLGIKQINK